ncbi:156_t:CDS:2, partial [Rhizophagus irregularis]
MPRSDKKDTTCACYDYKFTKPAKLRQHYQSNKNQCSLPPENINQRRVRIPKVSKSIHPKSPTSKTSAPLVHTQGRDRRMEQPKAVIPTPEPELASIKDGPKTEIFWICRNSKTVALPLKIKGVNESIDMQESLGTFENMGCKIMPKMSRDCQFLHNDLIQANDEAFELQPIMQDEKQEGDPKAGPGSTIQAHREGYKKE